MNKQILGRKTKNGTTYELVLLSDRWGQKYYAIDVFYTYNFPDHVCFRSLKAAKEFFANC